WNWPRREFPVADLLATGCRRVAAIRGGVRPVGVGTDDGESSIAAARETEEADAGWIDERRGWRGAHHVVDQPLDVGGSRNVYRKLGGTAHIRARIARMVDGGDNEARV